MFELGIDMGGTFTDFILIHDGNAKMIKIPSDKNFPLTTIMEGLEQLAASLQLPLASFLSKVTRFVHGNTVAINALIQKKGVKTALITTSGFRDTLEMRRSKLENQWDFFAPLPPVLVPRYLRFELKERVNYNGKIIQSLDENSLEEIVKQLKYENVESVAVCLLFSFYNPTHERYVKKYIEEKLPEVFVSISCEVAPKLGEYERCSTTVLNAYLTPLVANYLNDLSSSLLHNGLHSRIQLVQNNGGLSDIALAKEYGVKGLFSGPAAGSSGAKELSHKLSEPNIILVDMGGTSFDVSIIIDHAIRVVPDSEVEGYPVNIPLIDINSIGIGGGSIASVDEMVRFHVGPNSAEAYPGPACYGRGGKEPTITDAALVLGFIHEQSFGGGTIELKKILATQSIEEKLSSRLGISVEEAAYAIFQIAAAKMVDAIHLMTIQKGYDPREFALCAVGGASPIFATNIARELGIKKIMIPAHSEVFCAEGMITCPIKIDTVQSFVQDLSHKNISEINKVLNRLKIDGQNQLSKQGVSSENSEFQFVFEMRYTNQHHQIPISFTEEEMNSKSLEALIKEFHLLHEKHYGYYDASQDCSLINIRFIATEKVLLETVLKNEVNITDQFISPVEYRTICWEQELHFYQVPVYSYKDLPTGIRVQGPSLIEKEYTTIYIHSSFVAYVDNIGNLILSEKEEFKDEC